MKNERDYNESENYIDESSKTGLSERLIQSTMWIIIGLLVLALMLSGCQKEQYTVKKHTYKVTVGAFNANIRMTYNGMTIYPSQGQVIEFESRKQFQVDFIVTRYPNSYGLTVERDGVWHQEERRSLENKGDKTFIIK